VSRKRGGERTGDEEVERGKQSGREGWMRQREEGGILKRLLV